MCWNAPVSIIFSLAGFACTAFLLFVGRRAAANPGKPICRLPWNGKPVTYTKAAAWHSMFVCNIAFVELCEFLIWLDVLPLDAAASQSTCPTLNSIGTYGVFIFGFVNWMWLISLWAYMSSNEGTRRASRTGNLWSIPHSQ